MGGSASRMQETHLFWMIQDGPLLVISRGPITLGVLMPVTPRQTNMAMENPIFNREYIFKRSIFQPAMLVYQRVPMYFRPFIKGPHVPPITRSCDDVFRNAFNKTNVNNKASARIHGTNGIFTYINGLDLWYI